MPTLDVLLQIYMNKKSGQNFLKLQMFLFFSEVLSMCNNIKKGNTDNSATL